MLTSTLKNRRPIGLLLLLISPTGAAYLLLADTAVNDDVSVALHASVANLVREADPQNPDGGDYYEVDAESLRMMPIILQVNLYAHPRDTTVPLASRTVHWTDEIEMSVERDGRDVEGFSLRLIPGSELAISADQARVGDWRDARRNPTALASNESLASFFELSRPRREPLQGGRYTILLGLTDRAEALLGVRALTSRAVVFAVKSPRPEGDDLFTEDLIERHYLWGCWLYKFDRVASKKEFEKGWELVSEYIRAGAGDEPELWNITPRYQASRIAGWLDDKERQISYLSQLLSKDATAASEGRDCKMRFYHFHRERGHLPRNVRDDLTRGVNRLYERVYGKTMSGKTVTPQVPPEKNFPDASGEPADE